MDCFNIPKKVNRHVLKAMHFITHGNTTKPIEVYTIVDRVRYQMRNLIPVPNVEEVIRASLRNLSNCGILKRVDSQTYATNIDLAMPQLRLPKKHSPNNKDFVLTEKKKRTQNSGSNVRRKRRFTELSSDKPRKRMLSSNKRMKRDFRSNKFQRGHSNHPFGRRRYRTSQRSRRSTRSNLMESSSESLPTCSKCKAAAKDALDTATNLQSNSSTFSESIYVPKSDNEGRNNKSEHTVINAKKEDFNEEPPKDNVGYITVSSTKEEKCSQSSMEVTRGDENENTYSHLERMLEPVNDSNIHYLQSNLEIKLENAHDGAPTPNISNTISHKDVATQVMTAYGNLIESASISDTTSYSDNYDSFERLTYFN